MTRSFFAALVGAIAIVLGGAPLFAQNAYITNFHGNTVSVIATATNTVVGLPIPVGTLPLGVAVTPDGSTVYVANFGAGTVSVIATATNTVTATIPVGTIPTGVAVTPDGSKVYVANEVDRNVSVIDTATNTVVGLPIRVGNRYSPLGIAVTPDGSKVYVANERSNTVSVIDTATNTVVAALPVGQTPVAFGVFIQPRFAGTPGNANCYGKSVSALAQTFGGLNAAAIALGFPTLETLQTAVNAFCGAITM